MTYYQAKLIAALDRVLGSHSFLADTSSLLILEGKGPSWMANRKALVKMIYNRFRPISLRICSGTEAGFLVCGMYRTNRSLLEAMPFIIEMSQKK